MDILRSKFRSPSPLPPTAAITTPTNALDDAIKSFQDCLDNKDKVRLEAIKAVPDVHAVAQFTHQLDQENAKSNSRCVAARISPLLESIQQFSGVVETFVSSNPHVAALVWGSVKLVLQIASKATTYFDKLSALLMALGKRCPRFSEYQKLYRDSPDLQKVLCDFYSLIVRCCEQALKAFHRAGHIKLLKAISSSFDAEFAPIVVQIDQSSREVRDTILLIEAKRHEQERQDQCAEREAAEKHRLSSIIYRKEREKAEADWTAQMQLEKRKSQQVTKLEQFSDYDHKAAYWTACTQRHGSTGQWLTKTDDFKQWISGSNPSLFWFTGIIGSGKTVMTAFVIEQLSAKPIQSCEKLVYFFCQYNKEASLKATTVLRSIIRQLLDQDDRIFTENQSKIDALLDNLHNLSLMEALLSDIINCLKSVIVIIDGVDECSNSERQLLLKTLRNLLLRNPSGLKLYLAGDDRITDIILSFLTPSFVVNTHTPQAGLDLQELIHQLVLARSEDGDLVTGDPSLYQEIVDALCSASQGMVLWVKFQLQEICSQKTDESIRKALNHLPKGLSKTYNRLLSRVVEERNEEVCKKIFRFLATAKRPLSPEELDEAISVEPCQPEFMRTRLLNDINGIVRWCHGLIVFDDLDESLQFAHSSIKDFLCGSDTKGITHPGFHFQQHEADRHFGEICVTYLNFNDFKTQIVKHQKPVALPDPMMMASHVLGAGSPSTVLNHTKNMMKRRAKSTPETSRLLSVQTDKRTSQVIAEKYHLLPYASEFWLLHTTQLSLDQSRTWNLFRTLAEARYSCISESIINTLARKPGEDELCKFMYTCGHAALFHLYLVRLWNVKRLPLILASMLTFKCYPFIRLLPSLANKQCDSRWQELILSVSDFDLFLTMKQSDLEWLKDLTITERSRMLLKIMRAKPESDAPMKIKLIELGVDLYHECNNHGKSTTLLEELSRHPDVLTLDKVCDIMVRCGADFNRKITQDGRNALHTAAASGNAAAVSTILKHVSSNSLVNSTDDHGQTALHLAVQVKTSSRGNDAAQTARALLTMGASKQIKDASGRTAIKCFKGPGYQSTLQDVFDKFNTPEALWVPEKSSSEA